MKKKLEAELISLAHRILQLKNKEDIAVLQEEARKLYEKLSVLRFVEENLSDAKPTIGQPEIEDKLEKAYDYDEKVVVGEIPAEEEVESDVPKTEIAEKPEVEEPSEEVPAAHEISAMVEKLAASKNVSGDEDGKTFTQESSEEEISEEVTEEAETESSESNDEKKEKSEEIVSEEASEEAAETETSEEESSEQPLEEKTEEVAAETQAPTFEEGTQYEQPEAIEEIKLAEEANRASELFWESKPEDIPAADPSESELAKQTNTEAPENSKQDDLFIPKFELSFDKADDEKPKEDTPAPTFTFDDLLGKDYADPVFVKPEDLHKTDEKPDLSFTSQPTAPTSDEFTASSRSFETNTSTSENRSASLNDRLSKGITIGLNDRIAFMKNLFNNSSEDYNRVLSQLITFDNYSDAKNFIDNIVKPDYNNWQGKEEFEQRFMEIVEKRFN